MNAKIASLALIIAAAAYIYLTPADEPIRYNVLVISGDTLRQDALGAYDPDRVTPNIDSLAKSSHLYLRSYSQAPSTRPSVASLFTSKHPMVHRVLMYPNERNKGLAKIPESETTMAESFSKNRYQTLGIVANKLLEHDTGYDQGFEIFQHVSDDELTAVFIEFLDERDDRPFFAYLHYMIPHRPYRGHKDTPSCVARFKGMTLDPKNDKRIDYVTFVDHIRANGLTNAEDMACLRKIYQEDVELFDAEVGKLMDALEDAGLQDETIVVLTSDHGEEFGEHGLLFHGHSLFTELLAVPLMIHVPGDEPSRQMKIARSIDLFLTLANLTGSDSPDDIEGVILAPFAKPGTAGVNVAERNGMFRTVILDDMKLIAKRSQRTYSGPDDEPYEPTEEQKAILESHLYEIPPVQDAGPEGMEDLEGRLKDLGYI